MGLNVVCVYWKGDFRGRNYSGEWVRRLRNMVARNLDRPHRFACLSNVKVDDIETIPLERQDFVGWWAKMEIYRPGLFDGRVLYLDLDTLVVGDLGEIVDFPAKWALPPPGWVLASTPNPGITLWKGKRIVSRYQSSVMVFDAGQGHEAYERCDSDAMAQFRGDQDLIGHVAPKLKLLPKEWFGKLRDWKTGPNENHKVILSMPHKNDVAAQRYPWVKEVWC